MADFRYFTVNYRGNSYEFQFRYTYRPYGGWRAYIVNAPSYGCRSESLAATHRLDGGHQYYVCWSEQIPTRTQLDAVVELWSKATVMYIVDGGPSLDKHVGKLLRA